MTRLENWTLMSRVDLYGNPYQRLIGDVYNQPRANEKTTELYDGYNIVTSKIVNIDFDKRIAITQSGTVYELGFHSMVE